MIKPPSHFITEFIVTEEHRKLLRRMYVDWQDCETGAPAIDPKRPYGNSAVKEDIAEILGWKFDKEVGLNGEQIERAEQLHKETEHALQIFLQHIDAPLGTFSRDYLLKWKPI